MELRLLTTDSERAIFVERVAEARASQGAGFREIAAMRTSNERRLRSSMLYALYESEAAPAERMIAGLAMHDLERFPQSAREPDLSHLPPRAVLECSDHWSLSPGAGVLAWCGTAIPVRRMRARAILVYLARKPFDATAFYVAAGFVNAGEPVECPYVEMLDGAKILVQPMILTGEAMRRLDAVLWPLCVESPDDRRVIRFKDTAGRRMAPDCPAFPLFKMATAIKAAARNRGGQAADKAAW